MSFSHEVKRELLEHIDKQRDCRVAELSAILMLEGVVDMEEPAVYMHTESRVRRIVWAYGALVLLKEFEDDINPELTENGGRTSIYFEMEKFRCRQWTFDSAGEMQKAFIRGAFLSNGSKE